MKWTKKEILRAWKKKQLTKQDRRCHYCKCKMDTTTYSPGEQFPLNAVTVDHVVPRSRGGSDHPNNLVLACFGCNSTKGSTLVESNFQGARS